MATNDELRAAAERVRLCRSRSMLTVYGVESLPDATALYFDDAYAIAEARLSQPAPATDEQIAELKRLCEAATPGPWHYFPCGDKSNDCLLGAAGDGESTPPPGRVDLDVFVEAENRYECRWILDPLIAENCGDANYDDFAFMAHSRTAVPALIARLERAEAALKDAERWNAVLNCARIRILGTAGFDRSNSNFRHVGLELWTEYPDGESSDGAGCVLTAFADAAIAAQQETTNG